MSRIAQLKILTDELVCTILNSSKNAVQKECLQRATLQALTEFRPTLVNHFEIERCLAGLDERFRILNNDDLADTLSLRLKELSSHPIPWRPEILSLFLTLVDQPAQKSPNHTVAPLVTRFKAAPLTWTEILDDDPIDAKDALWDNVDFGANTSEEEYSIANEDPLDMEMESVSTDTSEVESRLDSFILPYQSSQIHGHVVSKFRSLLGDSAADRKHQTKTKITESQTVRESLSMLRGLPISVYVISENWQIVYSRQYYISSISDRSTTHVLSVFAELGTQMAAVRRWVQKPEDNVLQQAFQEALGQRIRIFDRYLSFLEARVVDCVNTITLLSALEEILESSGRFLQVATMPDVTKGMDNQIAPFKILELMYEAACFNQNIGDIEGYAYVVRLFLECFVVYLKPIQVWMESAQLAEEGGMFFVSRNTRDIDPDSCWHDQYRLIQSEDGHVDAPSFFHSSVNKILNAGKNVDFLKRLGVDVKANYDSPLNFESVVNVIDSETLSPFADLFNVTLNNWITRRYRASSIKLRGYLEAECDLQSNLDALEYVFLCRDKALTAQALNAIYDRLDGTQSTWNDRFILTEIFRSAFSALPCIDIRRLTVRSYAEIRPLSDRISILKALGTLVVQYPLSWPLANFIRPESITVYQRILVFLMQLQRTKYLLEHWQHSRQAWALSTSVIELRSASSLRHRLLWLANALLLYLTEVVLSTLTSKMRLDLAKAEDIDKMSDVHKKYLFHLEGQCLLSKQLAPIHQAIMAVMDLAISFTEVHTIWMNQMLGDRNGHVVAESRPRCPDCHTNQQTLVFKEHKENLLDVYQISIEPPSSSHATHIAKLKTMHTTFARLHELIRAGLRSVHRVGNEPCWETLADLLGYCSQG